MGGVYKQQGDNDNKQEIAEQLHGRFLLLGAAQARQSKLHHFQTRLVLVSDPRLSVIQTLYCPKSLDTVLKFLSELLPKRGRFLR
jgi:hypothetical protein